MKILYFFKFFFQNSLCAVASGCCDCGLGEVPEFVTWKSELWSGIFVCIFVKVPFKS
jgi:hypothetical protein